LQQIAAIYNNAPKKNFLIYSLGRHLIGFFILNKDLPLKSKRLTIVGLEIINIETVQKGESLAFVL